MTPPGRYQTQRLHAEQGSVTTALGVDPLTGLPVLIYSFPGRPTATVGALESENIPGVLAATYDGSNGQLVTAYSPEYGLVAPGEVTVTSEFVLEGARALRDAARAGVIHGDLRPGRLLHADGHVLIEGYGVPWEARDRTFTPPEYTGESSYPGDVYAFAKSVLHLGREVLPPEVLAVLHGALLPNPVERPSAESLYRDLKRALDLRDTPAPDGTAFGELTLPLRSAPPLARPGARAGARERPPARERRPERAAGDDPITLDTDPDAPLPFGHPFRSPGGTDDRFAGSFVKDLPPGGTYRTGSDHDEVRPGDFVLEPEGNPATARPKWHRFALLGLVLLAAATLALLLNRQRAALSATDGAPAGPQASFYIVNVTVRPSGLPPVTLYVLESPSASRWQPGVALDTVPGPVVLDQPGRWLLQGQFQDRRSAPVAVEVPADRDLTVVIPPAAGDPLGR